MNRLGNCLVAQSGGPTAVINASACGVIEAALASPLIGTVYGANNGIEGVLEENLFDFSLEDPQEIQLLKHTPASALGSCRYKLQDLEQSEDEYKKIFDIFEKFNIRYVFYIGGNDSMDTTAKLSAYAKKYNKDVKVLGIPKTIDNDLYGTDHCPGFGSAAKYLATSIMEIVRDGDVYEKNIVNIVEVMGRNAGWLAAATALANMDELGAPDLIYLPEVTFDIATFMEDVKRVHKKKGKVTVVVSEGVKTRDGKYLFEAYKNGELVKDEFGHTYMGGTGGILTELVRTHIEKRVKCVEFNVLQRAAAHFTSKTDVDEAYLAGQMGVQYALEGHTGKMVIFERDMANGYQCVIDVVDVKEVANKEKKVPLEWINKEGNYITKEAAEYILPLIQGEVVVPTENGLPRYARLKKQPAVPVKEM